MTLRESPAEAKRGPGGRLFDPGGGGSLDELISRVTKSLAVRGNARCMACGAVLLRAAEDEPEAPLASCASCGTRLE